MKSEMNTLTLSKNVIEWWAGKSSKCVMDIEGDIRLRTEDAGRSLDGAGTSESAVAQCLDNFPANALLKVLSQCVSKFFYAISLLYSWS